MYKCHHISRWCLGNEKHCRLPQALNGAQPHISCHHAYAQCELVRPYPLGTLPTPPQIDEVPCLDEALRHGTATGDRQQFEKAKEKIAKLWSKQRISSMPSDTKSSHRVLEPFLQRVKSLMQTRHQIAKRGDLHFEDPMQLEDLLAAYYYRAVQIALFIHKHLLGYCKHRVDDPCRFHLPRTEVCTTQHLSEETDRVEPLCRYLPDDRNVNTTIQKLHA